MSALCRFGRGGEIVPSVSAQPWAVSETSSHRCSVVGSVGSAAWLCLFGPIQACERCPSHSPCSRLACAASLACAVSDRAPWLPLNSSMHVRSASSVALIWPAVHCHHRGDTRWPRTWRLHRGRTRQGLSRPYRRGRPSTRRPRDQSSLPRARGPVRRSALRRIPDWSA